MGTQFQFSSIHLKLSSTTTSKMIFLLTTLRLLGASLTIKPSDFTMMSGKKLMDTSDPVLAGLLEEADSENALALERRSECRDTSSAIYCSVVKSYNYCYISALAEKCKASCDMCGDPGCVDSFKYGCQKLVRERLGCRRSLPEDVWNLPQQLQEHLPVRLPGELVRVRLDCQGQVREDLWNMRGRRRGD